MTEKNAFNELFYLDVTEKVEKKKSGKSMLSYLSWAWAWAEVKKRFPEAQYEIMKFENNQPYVYDEKTGYMVFTKVTIEGITHEMWLPVMDGANKAMKSEPYTYMTKYNGEKSVEAATMFDINKTIMRCLTKNLAMFGLGLHLFAGEDLPEAEPVKKVDETQVRGMRLVIGEIAELTNQKQSDAETKLLEVNRLPMQLNDLDVNQYGKFMQYLRKLKETYEEKAAKQKGEQEAEQDPEQEELFEERTTNPKVD